MKEQLYPYVIFFPKDRKQSVLRAIFGSKVPVDILKFALGQGITCKLYQKDLISNLGYSNKTVIERLKMLTELEVLEEHMEKSESAGRTVWLKYYLLSDLGRWFALLLVEEKTLLKEEKIIIVRDAFYSYVKWIKNLSQGLGMERQDLLRIFKEAMDSPD